MKKIFGRPNWSPYTVGTCIGILSWITALFMGRSLGTSPAFVRIAGIVENFFAPKHVLSREYFQKYLFEQPAINWMLVLVVCIFFGSMVSSYLGKSRTSKSIPSIWSKNFGSSKPLRYFWSFIGGVLVIFGARLAGGCTSGHGISGGMRLAASGWIFVVTAFSAAIITALMVYKKR